MSDAKLWIDDADSTATITGVNVSYTMPLWVFEDMRDIIVAESEKKVEVTHRDFDIQQELIDRYRADNARLRELCADMMRFFEDGDWCTTCEQLCKCEAQEQYEEDCLMRDVFRDRMHKLRVEVPDA